MKRFLLISGFFVLLFGLVSLVPHYNFRTNAFDLGIFNQTLAQYAHLKLGPNTVREVPTLLADHLEPILFFFAPLYFIFGSFTLLLLQLAAVVLGGYGIYRLLIHETADETLALGGTVIFYLSFGLLEALAFDYHNNVVGAMLIPWIFYFFSRKNFFWYYIVLVLCLICKENLALVTFFIGLSGVLFGPKGTKKHGVITLVASGIYFLLALKVIIPSFNHGSYDHWPYAHLGSGPAELFLHILFHPFQTVWLLFDDPSKLKFWILFCLSGGIFALFKPRYALVFVPLLAQRFLSDTPAHWGIYYHYSVEFAPLIALGAMGALSFFHNTKFRLAGVTLLVASNLFILSQISFYDGTTILRILEPEYYTNVARKELQEAMKLIPLRASVSAQNTLVPHLANHDNVSLFPKRMSQSSYIFLNRNESNVWPVAGLQELEAHIERLDRDPTFTKIFDANGVLLYEQTGE